MTIRQGKSGEPRGQSTVRMASDARIPPEPSFHFSDRRPEAGALDRLQALAGNSPLVQRMENLQTMANARQPAVVQRVVADCENAEKIKGFTTTKTFRELEEKPQAYFQVLYNDPQYRYTFDSRAEIIKYVTQDPSAKPPKTEVIEKDHEKSIEAYDEDGASGLENITKQTEQHHHHWRYYFNKHARIAYEQATTKEAKEEIGALQREYLDQAIKMDDSEIYYQMDFDSDSIEELRLAPNTIRAALEIMYGIANDTITGGPSLQTDALCVPVFGPISASGIGSSAAITLTRNGSFPQGSGAAPEHGANPFWYQQLNKRRTITGDNQYIRGHLLNDHMGGPARPYNLIPLKSDTNMAHFGLVEDKAKEAVKWMIKSRHTPQSPSPCDITSIHYRVNVEKQGQNRPIWSVRFRTAPESFRGILAEMNCPPANPTVAKFKEFVKNQYGETVYQNYFQMPIRAVQTGEDSDKIADLMPLIQANAELWDLEDKEVPSLVAYRLDIHTSNQEIETLSGSFDNVLPDDGKLKFKP